MITIEPETGHDFEQIYQSMQKQNLLLLEGAFCNFRHRKDNQITIYSIVSCIPGGGQRCLQMLIDRKPSFIQAVCPADMDSNAWYEKRGFTLFEVKFSRTGRELNVWRLNVEINNE